MVLVAATLVGMFPMIPGTLSVSELCLGDTKMWLNAFRIDCVVQLCDWIILHFVEFILVKAMNPVLPCYWALENFSEVVCSSSWQYKDYVTCKGSTVSNSKCAMPSISCLLSFIPSLYTFFFN